MLHTHDTFKYREYIRKRRSSLARRNRRGFSRRLFLSGLALTAIETTAGCYTNNEKDILPRHDIFTELPEITGELGSWPLEHIDSSRINRLLWELHTASGGSAEQHADAATASLRLVKNLGVGSEGSAFQIDESGIYLTARHVISHTSDNNELIIVKDPYSGKSNVAKACITHKTADVALLYAPTGRPPKPTPHMQLDIQRPGDNERVWMSGLFRENKSQSLYHTTKFGQIQADIRFQDTEEYYGFTEGTTKIAVSGMRPNGGTSGSPILNARGAIVAIESGFYRKEDNTVAGARVVPLSYVTALSRQSVTYY